MMSQITVVINLKAFSGISFGPIPDYDYLYSAVKIDRLRAQHPEVKLCQLSPFPTANTTENAPDAA